MTVSFTSTGTSRASRRALIRFFTYQGHWHDTIDALSAALPAARRLCDPAKEAFTHRYLGCAYIRLGRFGDANARLDEALRLAKAEFEIRRDIYTWDALAWVLYKRGEYPEAKDAIGKALRLHTSDPMLFFHAGMISRALNENDTATQYLGKALTINPQFHVAYAGEARQALDRLKSEESTHASR